MSTGFEHVELRDHELGREDGGRDGSPFSSDSSGPLWSVYLSQADKRDKELSESWEGDTQGILVFTGLFSATISGFILESYQDLTPDPNDSVITLLSQISQQLAVASNGTGATPPFVPSQRPFRPSTSSIRVNTLWFLSLTISLTCALAATLMQQWARQYFLSSHRHSSPHKRARVRAYLYEGVERFGLMRVVQSIPTLLHISVFLFFIGLIDWLFSINDTVASILSAFIALCALAYVLLTALPIIHINTPYRTPLSTITWYVVQGPVLAVLLCFNSFSQWLTTRQPAFRERISSTLIPKYRFRIAYGISHTLDATAAVLPPDIDFRALAWTLQSLDEDHEIEHFMRGIPGFLRSGDHKKARASLAPAVDQDTGNSLVAIQLKHLLETCNIASGLSEGVRMRRLLVCLRTIWSLLESFPQIHDMWIFGDSLLALTLRGHADQNVALTARCICALSARNRLADIHRLGPNPNMTKEFLATVMDVESSLLQYVWALPATGTFANIVGFVSGILPHLRSETLPDGSFTIAWDTLGVLCSDLGGKEASGKSVAAFKKLYDDLQVRVGEEASRMHGMTRCHIRLVRTLSILRPVYESARAAENPKISRSSFRLPRIRDILNIPTHEATDQDPLYSTLPTNGVEGSVY
ncbi:hypothetical protein BV25DRAFT_1919412 [Artomyces pyxidatus]|uniref:Uncharacterized protein n=1 Tax=Artomyces pyxidatus TaxID=48021 RepID=A0ACB8SQJ8_9AGAM|nr:hypothetical protein BV25DRAFT_1919412 [Artomyces pyxidatus]